MKIALALFGTKSEEITDPFSAHGAQDFNMYVDAQRWKNWKHTGEIIATVFISLGND